MMRLIVTGPFAVKPIRIFALCAMSVVLAACAQKYVAPSAGSAAKLRYSTNTDHRTQLTRLDTSYCPGMPQPQLVATTVGSILTQGAVPMIQMITSSEPVEGRVRDVLIEADKPFVFKVEMGQDANAYVGGYSCAVAGGFTPKAGFEYEMEFLKTDQGCSNRIYRLTRAGGGSTHRTVDPTQRYFRAAGVQDFCEWQPSQEAAVPQDILAALQAGEVSQDSGTPETGAPGSNAGETATSEPGGDLRAALQAPQPPAKAGSRPTDPVSAPRVGDRWKYRVLDGKRPAGILVLEIVDARGSIVSERITKEGEVGFSEERTVTVGMQTTHIPEVVAIPGGYQLAELAPYVPIGHTIPTVEKWSGLTVTMLLSGYGYGKQKFETEARVVGREKISVPAGRFDAVRIQMRGEKSVGSDLVRVVCDYWYSEDSMRTVKMSLEIKYTNKSFQSNPETYELIAYESGK